MSDQAPPKQSWLPIVGFAAFAILWLTVLGPKLEEKFASSAPSETQTIENTSDLPAKETPSVEKTIPAKIAEVADKVEQVKIPQTIQQLAPVFFGTTGEDNSFRMLIDPQLGVLTTDLGLYKKDLKDTSKVYSLGHPTLPSYSLTGIAKDWKFGQAVITGDLIDGVYKSLTITRPVIDQSLILVQSWSPSVGENASAYRFDYKITLKNTSTTERTISGLEINCGQVGPVTAAQGAMFGGMDQSIDIFDVEDEKVDYMLLKSVKSEIEDLQEQNPAAKRYFFTKEDSTLHWVSVKNRYFASIIDSKGSDLSLLDADGLGTNLPFKGTFLSTVDEKYLPLDGGEEKVTSILTAEALLPDVKVPAVGEISLYFDCFAGPQEYNLLNSLTNSKKDVMQLSYFVFTKIGWLGFISECLLQFLIFLKSSIGSYGLAIIALTVIIKGLLWPMTAKSNNSMKKMSALAPQMKELREKHKADPQVLNQKVMALYKEHNVSPLGGCLPMFLQMPIFIALYNTLRGAIELRHEGFLWAQDLSQADSIIVAGLPLNPLVILWAGAMVLQQKVVPSSADPAQKKMMMFMPVFMLFVCYSMPSGLTLYWSVSTLMTILQYMINNRKGDGQITSDTTATAVKK